MTTKLIQQGAEAKILLTKNLVIKDRISKSYRNPELDKKIIKRRTKSEAKLLTKASTLINCPLPLIETFLKGGQAGTKIRMPYIKGKKLSDHLDEFSLYKQKNILEQIGKDIAKLHDNDIIHGDLTTSNMILCDKEFCEDNKSASEASAIGSGGREPNKISKQSIASDSERIFFIDFGLGYISKKFEDRAVDIHLLKQALEAKHFKHWEALFKSFKKGYNKSKDSDKTLTQLEKVEKRGRYKH